MPYLLSASSFGVLSSEVPYDSTDMGTQKQLVVEVALLHFCYYCVMNQKIIDAIILVVNNDFAKTYLL